MLGNRLLGDVPAFHVLTVNIWGPGCPSTPRGPPGAMQHQTIGYQYDERTYNGDMGNTVKQNGPCAMGRDSAEEGKAMANRLMW